MIKGVTLWGTRSAPCSLPNSDLEAKIKHALLSAKNADLEGEAEVEAFIKAVLPFSVKGSYGQGTSCIQINHDRHSYLLCDAGSGLRAFTHQLRQQRSLAMKSTYHVCLTHLHWDHVCGFPLFEPAYHSQNQIIIHSYHDNVEEVFKQRILGPPLFPAGFNDLEAQIDFRVHDPNRPFHIEGIRVRGLLQSHPGNSYAYRFEQNDHAIVYATDSEHGDNAFHDDYDAVAFYQGADILICDAQYSFHNSMVSKLSWGHSSNIMAIELATRAQAKRLILFHTDADKSDEELDQYLKKSRTYARIFQNQDSSAIPTIDQIYLAYDGLNLTL